MNILPEDLTGCLYDTIRVSKPERTNFFTIPYGSKGKTKIDTNMEMAGQICTRVFRISSIACIVQTWLEPFEYWPLVNRAIGNLGIIDKSFGEFPIVLLASGYPSRNTKRHNLGFKLLIPVTLQPYEVFYFKVDWPWIPKPIDVKIALIGVARRPT